MTEKSLVRSVLDWLRAGYPGGVPGPDRVPLLALLRDTPLTEEQIKEVVREITAHKDEVLADGVLDRDEIEKFIEGVAHHDGGPENVKRVADLLAAAGWTLSPALEAADEKIAEE
ncbi:MAG TPA: DUF3349 domain-containing protein [Mycobacterium sp.]|nr:DUF3349 domain-containing protein [Mycobacterium sp.]HPZ94221.1 DUF3349 domain-containing protein [Mycobacterium sp.]HQE14859.1 DUF3349 domain-containing protein [Mycobacterium sp.]